MKLVKKGYEHEYTFAKMPKFIFEDEQYKELKSEDILLYTLIVDRISLSNINDGYTDDGGNLFTILPVDVAASYIRMSEKSARNSFKRLQDVGLIHIKRMGLQKPNRIYLVDIESLNGKCYHSRTVNTTALERKDLPPSNTKSIKTDVNNTKLYITLTSDDNKGSQVRFMKLYNDMYRLHKQKEHPAIEYSQLQELHNKLDALIDRYQLTDTDLHDIIELHFNELPSDNDGKIQYLLSGNDTQSVFIRHLNVLGIV